MIEYSSRRRTQAPYRRSNMHLLVVNCNMSESMTAGIATAATRAASRDTRVTVKHPSWGVESAEGYYDSFISAAAVLDLLTTLTEPYDGVVLAGFGEHGREGARQLLDVPVVDITEASSMAACLIGEMFGVVTSLAVAVPQIRASLRAMGLGSRCCGVRATGLRVLELEADRERTLELFLREARELTDAGADVLTLGCAGMAWLQERVQDAVDVPVVDGVAAAVALCEGLVRQGLKTSKVGGFAPPDREKSRYWSPPSEFAAVSSEARIGDAAQGAE